MKSDPKTLRAALGALVTAAAAHAFAAAPPAEAAPATASAAAPAPRTRLDHTGDRRVGIASYYARHFAGRTMADGTPMRPESDNAASRTLPFGTTALVTNLRNGRSAVVTIRDRGPYVKGRIIDLSPATARQLGMTQAGVTRVEIMPLSVPQPNGDVRKVAVLNERAAGSGGTHDGAY